MDKVTENLIKEKARVALAVSFIKETLDEHEVKLLLIGLCQDRNADYVFDIINDSLYVSDMHELNQMLTNVL